MLRAILCALALCGEPSGAGPVTWDDTAPLAVPLVAKWEGLRTTAYLDTIANPPVWTVCYGETRGVGPGDTYTVAQCNAMLADGLRVYWRGWHNCLTEDAAHYRLTPPRSAAYGSLAWNIGVSAVCRSTATRRLNAGDIAGGCRAIGWWNRAGDRVVRGLVNRRADEVAYCMEGLR